MTQVKFNCPEDLHQMLFNQGLDFRGLINEVLFGAIKGNQESLVKLKNALLSFHIKESEFPEIVKLEINDTSINSSTGKGQVVFEYTLGYSNTCAGTRTDILKKDRVNFRLDTVNNLVVFSLMELELRSTADEF
ncbi:hypothetical protein [Pedobacter sp. MC2016-24]|uniref:hypothetical protein n=1 Tax=Pedobacter sp. MC2016-24 TaxID=2780090 RepID=UPI00187FE381|nr:hypothetical protein [Pedobacter sp. MC2016-24]MBE9600804.1 hypothetical protein [Pedobacter sp. MC2016-24]